MLLENLTWAEAAKLVEQELVVIIPTGATEQHGPHLPLKVDIASADYIARAVGEKTGALVTPPLNFGYSELWHDYPGTISFTQDTYRAAMHDICHSLIRCGFKKLFMLNGHNPNLVLMQALAYELVDRYEDLDISIAAATYIFMANDKCNAIGENFRDGTHANEMETSIMLALFPELVDGEMVKKIGEEYEMRKCINFTKGATVVNAWPSHSSYHGAYGNPALASPEKGEKYLQALIEDISEFVVGFGQGKANPIGKGGAPQTL